MATHVAMSSALQGGHQYLAVKMVVNTEAVSAEWPKFLDPSVHMEQKILPNLLWPYTGISSVVRFLAQ
jgi:hypothetical protein